MLCKKACISLKMSCHRQILLIISILCYFEDKNHFSKWQRFITQLTRISWLNELWICTACLAPATEFSSSHMCPVLASWREELVGSTMFLGTSAVTCNYELETSPPSIMWFCDACLKSRRSIDSWDATRLQMVSQSKSAYARWQSPLKVHCPFSTCDFWCSQLIWP